MTTFRFEAFGEPLVARTLDRFAGRAEDMSPALSDVADVLRKSTRRRFDAQGSGSWPPLAPATVAAKARAGLDPRVLHATGTLRRSLTRKGDPNQELIVAPRFLVYGSKIEYARHHQLGEGVPQRRPLAFDEPTKVQALKILQRYLVEAT